MDSFASQSALPVSTGLSSKQRPRQHNAVVFDGELYLKYSGQTVLALRSSGREYSVARLPIHGEEANDDPQMSGCTYLVSHISVGDW